MNGMNAKTSQTQGSTPVRKTRTFNFSIVVDYAVDKWEDNLFGIEVELSSRLFDANEECGDIQVMHTSSTEV